MEGIFSKIYASRRLKKAFCISVALAALLSISGKCDDYTLAPELDMTKPAAVCTVCGMKNTTVIFSAETIENQLGLKTGSLSGIVITGLPGSGEGSLTICGETAQVYETINRDGIDRMQFNPRKGCAEAKFCFIPLAPQDEQKYSQMTIAFLDRENVPPTAGSGTISTVKDMSVKGRLSVTDEDIGNVKISVTSQPKKGTISFNGDVYTYTPFAGMSGGDSFKYKAVDKYGYASAEACVRVDIEKNPGLTYEDMRGNTNACAAVKLAERGVMTGTKIGGKYYFIPNEVLSQGDFLLVLLAVVDKSNTPEPCVNTGLKNDAALPVWLKPYVAKAVRNGILEGGANAVFDYSAPITRGAAVLMIQNAAQVPDSTVSSQVFEDLGAIPQNEIQPFVNLYANNIYPAFDGVANASGKLARGDAAGILYNTLQYCDKNGVALSLN